MAAARAGSGAAGRWPATATTSPSRRRLPEATSVARIASAPSAASAAVAPATWRRFAAARARTSVSAIPGAPGSAAWCEATASSTARGDRVASVVRHLHRRGPTLARRSHHAVQVEAGSGRGHRVARRDGGGEACEPLGRLAAARPRGGRTRVDDDPAREQAGGRGTPQDEAVAGPCGDLPVQLDGGRHRAAVVELRHVPPATDDERVGLVRPDVETCLEVTDRGPDTLAMVSRR